jgi:ATP-dependent DNA helicase RecQ
MLREPTAKKRKEKRRAGAALDLSAQDAALFERLRDWRRQTALEHDVPAYVIFHDATLREIALRKPVDLAELGGIAGIGARKLEAYGTSILQVVNP